MERSTKERADACRERDMASIQVVVQNAYPGNNK
jgi:hypothetical protein